MIRDLSSDPSPGDPCVSPMSFRLWGQVWFPLTFWEHRGVLHPHLPAQGCSERPLSAMGEGFLSDDCWEMMSESASRQVSL